MENNFTEKVEKVIWLVASSLKGSQKPRIMLLTTDIYNAVYRIPISLQYPYGVCHDLFIREVNFR